MDRNTAIARIQRGLGFRTDLVETIALAMQEQQRLLERGKTLPFFLLQEDQTLSFTAGNSSANLPERFLRVSDEDGIWYIDDEDGLVQLTKMPYAEANAEYSGEEAGPPEAYSLRKDTIVIWPTPDVDYDLTWSYYKGGQLLTTNIENEWLANAPDVLIGAAGISIATDVRDATAVQTFTALYAAAWQNELNEIAAREDNDMPRALGRNN